MEEEVPLKRKSVRDTRGPHGLGDPDDKFLRIVEKDVVISKKMRDIARLEKCATEVKEFNDCCVQYNGFMMAFKCRPETKTMWECMGKWFKDEDFRKEVTEMYLKERSAYRTSGITKMRGE